MLETKLDTYDIPINTLSLYHTNIHSLPDKYDRLKAHLEQYKNTPDIITITDNYLQDDTNQNSYPIEHYTAHHKKDITTYTKNNMHVTTEEDIEIPQAATIILQIHKNKQKNNPIHTIINVYRRPHTDHEFITNLQTTIDQIYTKHPNTSITIQGDINVDLLKLPSKMYLFLIENNLHTTITTPTRYDPHHQNTATTIDVTLTTRTQTPITAGTISPPLSDHLPTYTIFHNPVQRQQHNATKTLSINRYNKQKETILTDIKTALITSQNTDPTTTTSQHFHNMQKAIQATIEKHEVEPKPPRKPWCTPKYKRHIIKQHKLHRERINAPTTTNIKRHARYRNKLNKKIKETKRKYITEQIESTKHDPKQQAKILKQIIPSKSNARTSPTTINYNGKVHTKPQEIANAINDHYITIGHKTTQTIPQDEEIENDDPIPTTAPLFKLKHITEKQVEKTMKQINANKASDIYKIKPAIIKDLTAFLTPALTTLFNRSIDEQEYPDSLKFTKVIEIYKAKDKTLPENYRPISLLPIIAKLLDTIINNQLMDHLIEHNLISPTQYAFRPNSSTTLALQTIIDNIHKHISQHKPTLAIYVDLSKAYDTISHSKLLHKLRHEFNFSPETTTYFASYFRNRQQSTHTQHAESTTQTITHGIPQGSTLSTTFFLLYINNIIRTVPNSKVYTYADDTTLIITAATVQDLQQLAQSELTSLINYFHANNLVPNPTKTNYTIFFPIAAHDKIELKINKTTLKQNTEAKLLGLYVQNKLKHQPTITNIIKKLQPVIQKLRYASKFVPTHTMKQLYYTHAFPHLIGSAPIWGTEDDTKTYIQPLIRTQKKLLRIIKHLPPRTHTKPIMKELKILSLTNLYIQRVCTEIYPFIHQTKQKNRPEHNHDYIWTTQIHEHQTRYSQQQHHYIPNPHNYSKTRKSNHTMEHLTSKYTQIWNTLPQALRNNTSLPSFKTELRLHLLEVQEQH
jgi:hypothetical protein